MRNLFLIAAVWIPSLILARLILGAAESSFATNDRWLKRRYTEAIRYVPEIARDPAPILLAMGASEVERTIDPAVFDADLAGHGVSEKSYNLGFRNQSPTVFSLFADRLIAELHGREIDAVIVQFTPSRATERFEQDFGQSHALEDEKCAVMSGAAILRRLGSDPSEALELLALRYFLGGVSPAAGASYIGEMIFDDPESFGTYPVALQAYQIAVRSLWYGPAFQVGAAWDPVTRGFYDWGLPTTEKLARPLLATLDTPASLGYALESQNRRADLSELKFSPRLVSEFIAGLQKLRSISKHVIVFELPEHPKVVHGPEAMRRLRETLIRIRRESGAELIDLSETSVRSEDFSGINHFSRTGRLKIMNELAEEVARSLKNSGFHRE